MCPRRPGGVRRWTNAKSTHTMNQEEIRKVSVINISKTLLIDAPSGSGHLRNGSQARRNTPTPPSSVTVHITPPSTPTAARPHHGHHLFRTCRSSTPGSSAPEVRLHPEVLSVLHEIISSMTMFRIPWALSTSLLDMIVLDSAHHRQPHQLLGSVGDWPK